jgi:hypothetical protein
MFESVKFIRNKGKVELPIFIEPWGWSYSIPVGETFELVGKSQYEGDWEIEPVSDGIIFWAWNGTTFRLKHEHIVLCESDISFPNVPEGQSTSSILKLLFGKTKMQQSNKWQYEVS